MALKILNMFKINSLVDEVACFFFFTSKIVYMSTMDTQNPFQMIMVRHSEYKYMAYYTNLRKQETY